VFEVQVLRGELIRFGDTPDPVHLAPQRERPADGRPRPCTRCSSAMRGAWQS
jgi:hypothetical protein